MSENKRVTNKDLAAKMDEQSQQMTQLIGVLGDLAKGLNNVQEQAKQQEAQKEDTRAEAVQTRDWEDSEERVATRPEFDNPIRSKHLTDTRGYKRPNLFEEIKDTFTEAERLEIAEAGEDDKRNIVRRPTARRPAPKMVVVKCSVCDHKDKVNPALITSEDSWRCAKHAKEG